MKNVFILGSGRSGTSLAAALLDGKGFYMGESLHPPTKANPKGFFESWEINSINEELLAQVLPKQSWFGLRKTYGMMQRWLAPVPAGTFIPCPLKIQEQIQKMTGKQPICFKDPRFSYTLPVWRPFFKEALFVCVFRDPGITVSSILEECKTAPYLKKLKMGPKEASDVWCHMYKHILQIHSQEGAWLFLHYEQLFDAKGLDRFEQFLGISIDRGFVDKQLKRTSKQAPVSAEALKIYEELCQRAGYQPKSSFSGASECAVS